MRPLAIVAFAFPTAFAASAGAQSVPTPSPSPESAELPRAVDRREGDWRLEAGYRGSFVPDSGYQPSRATATSRSSPSPPRTQCSRTAASPFAGGLAWDVGSSSSKCARWIRRPSSCSGSPSRSRGGCISAAGNTRTCASHPARRGESRGRRRGVAGAAREDKLALRDGAERRLRVARLAARRGVETHAAVLVAG